MKNSIDYIKGLACLLIIGSHCFPLFQNDTANFYYGQWFFRFCVPFFFVSTGYFFAKMSIGKKTTYIRRIAVLYVISSVLYLPLILKSSLISIVYQLVYGFTHLWYLSALLIGLLCILLLDRYIGRKKYIFIALLLIGIVLDEYYKLFDINILNKGAKAVQYLGGARNAFFFAIPLLLIGQCIEQNENRLTKNKKILVLSVFICFLLGYLESNFLFERLSESITLDVSFFGWTPAIPLFLLGLTIKPGISSNHMRKMRKITDYVYIIHLWIIHFVRTFTDFHFFSLYVVVSMLSIVVSVIIAFFVYKLTKVILYKVDKQQWT